MTPAASWQAWNVAPIIGDAGERRERERALHALFLRDRALDKERSEGTQCDDDTRKKLSMSAASDDGAIRITAHDAPRPDDVAQVTNGLADHVAERFGPRDENAVSIFAHDAAGALVGGINGSSHWHWLYIRNLWIAETWRNRGVGERLMTEAERLARERACVGLYLDTFDPDAERFYRRCGFTTFGRIEDFPPGHARRFLSRKL